MREQRGNCGHYVKTKEKYKKLISLVYYDQPVGIVLMKSLTCLPLVL